ncbi:MAG: hypothetical protein HYT20_02050 [Candidatus Nealsonbacteria bacterium]|nr:hypothetical protein [Candidatus Nealsonbacteria bacterium]
MPQNVKLRGIFEARNLEVRNVDGDIRVEVNSRGDDNVVVVNIVGPTYELLEICVSRRPGNDTVVIEGGYGSLLNTMRIDSRHNHGHAAKAKTKIAVGVPRGASVYTHSISGSTAVDEGIRVCHEID